MYFYVCIYVHFNKTIRCNWPQRPWSDYRGFSVLSEISFRFVHHYLMIFRRRRRFLQFDNNILNYWNVFMWFFNKLKTCACIPTKSHNKQTIDIITNKTNVINRMPKTVWKSELAKRKRHFYPIFNACQC